MGKAKALQLSNGNYDASVISSNEMKKELCWWITNIMSNLQRIYLPDPHITIYTAQAHQDVVSQIGKTHQKLDGKHTR